MFEIEDVIVQELVVMQGQGCMLDLTAFEALALLAQVQFALSQPGNLGATAHVAERVGRRIELALSLPPSIQGATSWAWGFRGPTVTAAPGGEEEAGGESAA